MAKIIIKRKAQIVGCAQSHNVYIFTSFIGELKNGGVLEIPVNVGTYPLSFNSTMKKLGTNATFNVVVNNPDEIVELKTKFGMNGYEVKLVENRERHPISMSIRDIFHASKIKKENERLLTELEDTKKLLTPEMMSACTLKAHIRELQIREKAISNNIDKANTDLSKIISIIDTKQKMLIDIEEQLMYQDFALYKPKYELINSEAYKERLIKVREEQKALIKNNLAVFGNMDWTVNGSKSEGKKMVKDMQKLLLRAFNAECDEVISRVTYANIDLSEKRINASFEAISKLGRVMSVAITYQYLRSKLEELHLAFEYKQKKQEEKEEQKELRAQLREEAKLQKEIEEARKKIQKEQKHYQNALDSINKQLLTATDEQKADLEQKKIEIEAQLNEIDKNIKDIDYRESNAKAGYVYIISNIGAFGENIYKIGMTRRLDPQERIDELSDASVPFNFDVHAMIFSDNAPALEASLHKAFESKKLNMVNQRREFFNVTLDEIKAVVMKNFDKSVEFIEVPEAEQYRTSLKMKEQK